MNKVITINLNGNAYQLEEGGYELLRQYLDGASRRLEGNPDQAEIVADIEQAIADKCQALLGSFKTVVVAREMQQIIEEMGPVENAPAEGDPAAAGSTGGPQNQSTGGAPPPEGSETFSGANPPRRLFLIPEGAMLGGVCNGLAAYLHVDVTVVRVAFVLLSFLWGLGILVYIVLNLLLPTAGTSAEKAAAQGMPATAQEFIRRAREGYYEGMKNFSDKSAHREWKRRYRQQMRGWRQVFRHEMRGPGFRWGPFGAWHHWTPPAPGTPPSPGAWFALPFVSLLRGALVFLWIFAMVSLLSTGAVYGVPLPAGIPVWAALLILIFSYKFVAWPLKAMRRACYYSTGWGSHPAQPFIWAFEAVLGVAMALIFYWLATEHWSEIQQAIHALPATVHQGIDAVHDWWTKH